MAPRTFEGLTFHPIDLRWSWRGTLVATWDRWNYQKGGSQNRVPGLVCKLTLQTRGFLKCPYRLWGCEDNQIKRGQEEDE